MEASASRLGRIYETAFRSLLLRSRPAHVQRGVELLLDKALRRMAAGEPLPEALQAVYSRCREQTIRRLCLLRTEAAEACSWSPRRGTRRSETPRRGTRPSGAERRGEQLRQLLESRLPARPHAVERGEPLPDFHCDAGLGGLARWLRAHGYDARFWPGVRDDDLLEHTLNSDAILLTTDRPLVARAAVRWGVVPALLVPLETGKRRQLSWLVERLQLPRRPARCMQCGGRLRRIDKESARDEIPPRTYPWCDDYYRCRRCGKLFWKGTHWRRIDDYLRVVSD